ncbi:lipid IV(A) 3-deoxy-D-manno-octulosonic acid transferase [Campylobacter fetus]|uniref:lipid IV(A) 3-deoxy-D-manno-octulosonic acid transferase n=1 Tax=Campylobacter fetus TaxID=196 RepID=UPI000818A55F|nr:lipid IV(A) 3-deoxy-D-manno-octulosonic acid transferase [Campylobacter fetus]OCR88750.1 3-deoxy-D-manno-octulosonic acid transferase [Campylobacter fetus subsp. testudinum]OCR93293.1 3-deoxy-D-manno-octulosonic acid transferase [Campylobacter fetus subsp. testudinum]OCR96361.1 3-deoxy-D-manno-octulosonic acid transferase [Campylobacter fetus subsp. testudinum]OCS03075.1 3-deoxy-D-manno-octulosonic acid transferase [Campylobacter fetus subsp. testudinum]
MIYTFLSFVILILASPFLALLSFKSKFKNSIPARFFLKNSKKLPVSNFHFHACSLGEVASIEPFFHFCENSRISVITQTGFDRAKKLTNDLCFLPFECFLPFWWSECRVLVVFEAELWLNLFKIAKKNGSKTILLNARISDKSYKSYLRFKFYYKWLFTYVDLVLAQSDTDKIRLESLGAKNVKVIGNVKSANLPKPTKIYQKPQKRVITIASSHENEEKQILSLLNLKDNDMLFIAPRHPERFQKVDVLVSEFASKKNLSYEKFSQNLGFKSDVVLIDTLGELVNIYNISDIVVLCGSFEKGIGGHNPIEAAQFNCSIISGEFIHNQKSLFGAVDGVVMSDYKSLNKVLNSNLKKCSIKNRCDFNAVLQEIKSCL